jgi:hypothetical protein
MSKTSATCKLNCFTRSLELQREKVEECKAYIAQMKHFKVQAASSSNEYTANQFFHMQSVLNALHSTFSMWCSIKNTQYQQAWNQLVDAQEYVVVALKIQEYKGITDFQKNLSSIEEVIFPSWSLFNSPGMIETIGKCSICGENFALCDHVENGIYMGSMCQRISREIIEYNHTAFVKIPRDRRCIITEISDDEGCMIDSFTWEKTGENCELSEDAVANVKAVMLNCNGLDVA